MKKGILVGVIVLLVMATGIAVFANSLERKDFEGSLKVATQWAEAVKMRDGNGQYQLMGPDLQKETYQGFADLNWSTGTSSPWVDSYTVTQLEQPGENVYQYEIVFVYTDSTESRFDSISTIRVELLEKEWLITEIIE